MKLSTTPLLAATLAASVSASSSSSLRKNTTPRALNDVVVSEHEVSHTEKVMYVCTVTSSWSAENHPKEYPTSAHNSPPVLVSHSADYKMFTPGEKVSPGVKLIAETGLPTVLIEEFKVAGDAIVSHIEGVPMWFQEQPLPARARKLADGGALTDKGIPADHILSRTQTLDDKLIFTPKHTMFSAITMLAPSPDWFTASHGFSPVEGDFWLKSFKVETMPYDAGTDSGTTFLAENVPTDPAEGSKMLTVENSDGFFVNTAGDAILPVMAWECAVDSVMYTCEFDDECDPDGKDSAAVGLKATGLASALMAGLYLLL